MYHDRRPVTRIGVPGMNKPSDHSESDRNPAADPVDMAVRVARLMERAQRALIGGAARQAEDDYFQIPDPRIVMTALTDFAGHIWSNPTKLLAAQIDLWCEHMMLWNSFMRRSGGQVVEPVIAPPKDDKRFADDWWNQHPGFDFVKQAYLLNARWLEMAAQQLDEFDAGTQHKIAFYLRQFIDACAPTNFVAGNPRVLRETLETRGANLIRGLEHLVEDLERGEGRLDIRMTDEAAFRLGENIAATPGKVVFQNDLIQLIQYTPLTDEVYRRPLLIMPPWINKFYILDLKPQNSFIRWAVEQRHTVFVISWVNPDKELSRKTFESYMLEGPLAALDAITQATGETDVNVIGYCIGGTLLACTLASMAKRKDRRFASATFFTALTDFTDAGEIKVFIDEEQIQLLEHHVAKKGYLEGHHMARVFNLLRDNDLIWSFAVNNYLLGREPLPFDLLYWNADSTRMPAAMHSFYLRNMYLENRLVEAGGITLGGVPLDLHDIALPIYQLSAESDHIAPWKSTYALSCLVSGPYKFVLSGSGHIAGVINPPVSKKYCYWTNPDHPATPEEWLSGATRHDGSWWTDWALWVAKHGGDKVSARLPGDGGLKALEDAPGSYVKIRVRD